MREKKDAYLSSNEGVSLNGITQILDRLEITMGV